MAKALPDEAWVVRGGVATPEQLQRGVAEHEKVPGLYGFSVQSILGASVEELARAGLIPNRQLSVCKVGDLREVGFDVVTSPGGGHHATVVTPDPLPDDLAQKISQTFRQQPNPRRKR